MKRFDREHFLRMVAWTGAGATLGGLGLLTGTGKPITSFLITSNPDRDRDRLLSIIDPGWNASVNVKLIQPVVQDVGLLLDGQLVDPIQNHAINGLRDMAYELRRRTEPGRYFVTIASNNQPPTNEITIAVDGQVVHRFGLHESHSGIVVPGKYGQTTFNLRDGALAVTGSSCRHGLCSKLGWVSEGKIICAPNRLVASIGLDKAGPDTISS